MAASAVKVIVVDGKEITQSVDLRTTKQGSATKVKAIKGGKFILADADTGAAPENITVHRVGNDLHVSLEGTGYEDPELIIEGFYSADGQGEELVGVAEDGAYYEYIASDAEANHEAGMLGEGVSSPLVLGRNPLVGFGSGLVPAAGMSWLGLGLFGLGALGLIGAALAGDNGGGNGGNPGNPGDGGNPGNPGDGKLTIGDITDNVGTTTGSIPPGGSTDDNTPTIIGDGGTPGKVITIIDNGKPIGSTIVDDDGKWTFTPDNPLDDGPHEIVVIEDGKPPSDGRDIIIDTVAPAQVLIESALDDAGSSTGFLDNGAMTDDKTPTLSGKAEAGSLVKLYADGNEVGSIVADADGNWTITSSELPDGPHKFTATATDAAGNVGLPSADWVVVVDTMEGKPAIGDVTDDVGSKTGTIPNGGDTDDNTPTLSGGGGGGLTPGSTVVISDGGNPIGTAIVGDDGKWEFTPPPLDDGKHDFTVVVTDPAGNTSDPSDPWTVNIDTLAPDAPTIDLVIDDQGASTGPLTSGGPATDDAQPTVSGKAEPNSIVTLYDGDKAVGSTKADASGNWTITPDFPLSLGEHNLTAKASDAAGNISDPSNQFDLDVATGGVPTAPAIIGVNDDNGATPVPVAENGFTNDNTPVVIGTAPAGSVVMIYVDGNPVALGSATSDADGNWSFPVPAANPLTDGLHNFTASAGGVSTGQYPINIDTTAPGASTDLSLIDDVGARTGEIADNDTTDDANPTYSGKAEPGTSVVVIVDGVPVKTVPVDAGGNWTYTPETPLADGAHTISNQVVDQAGNSSPVSAPTHFIVDTGAVTIAITQVDDNEGSITGPISNHGVTDDTTPTVHGTATANSLVHIYVDGNPVAVGSVMADGNGDWVFTPTLTEGPHTITATSTNAAGVVSDSNEFDLTVDTTAPAKPEIGDVIDDVGTQTGSIPSDGGVTDDTTPTLVGGGLTPGDKVIISDGGNPIGTAIVGDDGKWEFTPTTPLNPGDHEFTIVVEDPAGNTSDPSDPWDIVIDTGVPDAPTIDLVIDDQGASTGPLTSGGPATDDAQPTVSGKAEPGSIVTLYDGDKAVGSTQANASGDWTITPDFPLDLGAHNLTAKATDAAGNVSDPSNQFDLDVATGGVPTAPAIIGVIDDDGASPVNVAQNGFTNDNTPVVVGTAPAGSVVMVYVDGNPAPLGSATSDADGNWSFPVPAASPLADGLHNFTASAGGVSTGQYPINIDTGIPAAATDLTLIDDIGARTGEIADNDTTDDANPTYSGKAEPGTSVVVIVDGVPVKTVPVDAGGNWTYTPETPLADGPHTISNQVVDQAGNTSPVSAPTHFIVDTSAVAIAITQVDDNEGSITGPIANHGVTDDTTPTVHGTATANSLVHIYVDGNPVAVGSVMADGLGNWEFTPTLTEGPHTITATSTNAAGVVSDSNEFDLTVDITAPGKPAIGDVIDNVGDHTGTIPSDGGVTDDTTPTLVGDGLDPGDKVIISDGGDPIGTAIVGDDGRWEFTPTTPLNPGDHEFIIVVEDPAGNTSEPSDPWDIVIDTDAPAAPTIDNAFDDVLGHTGNIGSGGLTNDNTPQLSGTAERGSIVFIRDGANVIGSATADSGTDRWVFDVPALAGDGSHTFTAVSEDAAGNSSPVSNNYDLILDTTAPAAPTIDNVLDNVGITGNIGNGGTTDDSTPTISGRGEVGAIVTLFDGANIVGSAQVRPDGTWTIDVNAPVGGHTYTATQTDVAGNTSPDSAPYGLNVVPFAPVALSENFDAMATANFGTADQSFVHNGLRFSVTNLQTPNSFNGIGPADPTFDPGNTSNKLAANGIVTVAIDNAGEATGISIRIGNINTNMGPGMIEFLDKNGAVVGTQAINAGFDTGFQQISFNLPAGSYFSSFRMTPGILVNGPDAGSMDWWTYDNIVVNGVLYPPVGTFGTEEVPQDASSVDSLTHATAGQDDATANDDDATTSTHNPADDPAPVIEGAASFTVQEDVQVHVEQAGDSPVLVLEGANQVLDISALTAAEQAKVADVKVIDITGTGDNTLHLSLNDVLEQGGKGLFIDDGKTQMMVKGDAGDVVNLDDLLEGVNAEGDWTQAAGSVTVEGVAYNVYQHTGLEAELLVQQGVTTNLS
ncbi:Ig-like domain-containing protein [Collimonas fungivorans]|uniref:Large repetitive protein n=1 Tax=Collimonas fungivorans (strain Ter331) TaxID=1005048 RepID=G0ADG2_COLFT|nr:Ig-like domain-containing protein [Collimonas fungivorans]AEK63424.1 Large repetitive protein [Collimonas fungivorans Ter331]